ncbi:MAG: hypothetical protein IJV62_04705, partial [Eggerthellaceae bacterium]|nr:hypothetical protein [Eggerthellaceae bacterium]
MDITYTPELQSYMKKKGYEHIIVELAEAAGCCAGFADIVARFATDKQVEVLNKQVIRILPG